MGIKECPAVRVGKENKMKKQYAFEGRTESFSVEGTVWGYFIPVGETTYAEITIKKMEEFLSSYYSRNYEGADGIIINVYDISVDFYDQFLAKPEMCEGRLSLTEEVTYSDGTWGESGRQPLWQHPVANVQTLALANMVANGKPFCIVQCPDWNGGHYCTVKPHDYKCGNFEYIRWSGTPLEFAMSEPYMIFDDHHEPLHEESWDDNYSGATLLRGWLNQ